MNKLEKFSEWAKNRWHTLSQNWSCNSKHYYKEFFVSKEINKTLHNLQAKGKFLIEKSTIRLVDFGCGDGFMTGLILRILSKYFPKSRFEITCVELTKELLECTEKNIEELSISNIEKLNLLKADISKPQKIDKFDIVFSSFVLHNIADWITTLKNFHENSSDDALHIHAFLCPLFVDVLRYKGILEIVDSKEFRQKETLLWRYVAKYPILGDEGQLTYFPYFHRFVGDYISAFLRTGISLISFSYHLPTDKNLLNIPPFQPSEKNLYFPEIWNYPSLNIFVGKKEGRNDHERSRSIVGKRKKM